MSVGNNLKLVTIFATLKVKIITYFFLALFAAQSLGNLFLYIDYYVNKSDYLAKCVNKNRPSLKCNGQCLLMKKIRAKEKQDQKDAEKRMEYKIEVLDSNKFELSLDASASALVEKKYQEFIPAPLQDRAHSLLRPPAA